MPFSALEGDITEMPFNSYWPPAEILVRKRSDFPRLAISQGNGIEMVDESCDVEMTSSSFQLGLYNANIKLPISFRIFWL